MYQVIHSLQSLIKTKSEFKSRAEKLKSQTQKFKSLSQDYMEFKNQFNTEDDCSYLEQNMDFISKIDRAFLLIDSFIQDLQLNLSLFES